MSKIAVVGGGGAMGGLFGGYLARAGCDVTLIDVSPQFVDIIKERGLAIKRSDGSKMNAKLSATVQPGELAPVDLVIVFVKAHHTEAAIRSVASAIGPDTVVLTLQNGWGNSERIASIVGTERLLLGITYHSGTLIEPGVVGHTGSGRTIVGELSGQITPRLEAVAAALDAAGLQTVTSPTIVNEIWKKLALNCCLLPPAALARFETHELVRFEDMMKLMQGILAEVVSVASAIGLDLDYAERWAAVEGLAAKAVGGKVSMLQDVESRRRTEIETVNGAIVEAGLKSGVPTPLNQAMVWLIKSVQGKYMAG